MYASTWPKDKRTRAQRLTLRMNRAAGVKLRSAIRSLAEDAGIPSDITHKMLLGTTEACSNAIKHGDTSASNLGIEACVHISSDEFVVRLYYKSQPFIFADHETVDNNLPTTHGHYVMSRVLDEVHYYFRRGCTLVRLVKHL